MMVGQKQENDLCNRRGNKNGKGREERVGRAAGLSCFGGEYPHEGTEKVIRCVISDTQDREVGKARAE